MTPGRSFSLALSAVLCLSLVTGPALAQAQQPTRDQQFDELQKQIDALKKKLEELRVAGTTAPVVSIPTGAVPDDWIKSLTWRSIGPASMGGRIVAISVYEADPTIFYIATASGGLLKTINNGITFEHQFDREATVSLGDVCVAQSDPNIVWVGTGEANPRNSVSHGDGVYKSTDGGKTWKNMGLTKSFQIGKILIHPKDPNTVYCGALGRLYGPNEERGLFKTTDGGKTWNKVLHIDSKTGIIDMRMSPADPETLIVAAYDRQRDEFDTHPGDPVMPDGYDSYDPIRKWGPGAGLYKTSDGGKTFRKLAKGLPTCQMGRIGLDWYRKDPKVVYAVIDTEKIGMTSAPAAAAQTPYLGVVSEDADAGARLREITANSPAAKAGLQAGDIVLGWGGATILSQAQLLAQIDKAKVGDKVTLRVARKREIKEIVVILQKRDEPAVAGTNPQRPFSFMYGGQRENAQDRQGPEGYQYGGVYRSTDAGESWTRINSVNPRPMYFSQIRVDPSDDKFIYVLGVDLYRSKDGGKTFTADGNREVHPDQHALWIDPRDGRHMIVGCDGGFYQTFDRMANWDFLNNVAIGQFYHVCVDTRQPYRVYGGLQDNGTWGGPSRSLRAPGFGFQAGPPRGPTNDDWLLVGGGDGFVCRVDPNDPDTVYWEYQDGSMFRRDLRTNVDTLIRPRSPEPTIQINWKAPFLVGFGPFPLVAYMPNLVKRVVPYRFNWNTPYILSHQNSKIFYAAGNHVFRSINRGADLRPISPEITRTKTGSATALAESPRTPEVLYVGTDDGYLWVTRDAGKTWTNITANVGLPGPRWVSSIEPSRYVEARCYATFDAHRSNDDEPYVYVTEDYGQTWKSLRANLPSGSTRVLREDLENSSLLFLGTEFAAWVSTNRGASWTRLNNNLPTVAVHEFAIHPTAGEMVAATHGRSLWVLDITPLRGMTVDALKAPGYLYPPNTVVRWRSESERNSPYGVGARRFVGQNPPAGAQIYYSLTKKAAKVELKVVDYLGKTVMELGTRKEPGLHRITWPLLRSSAKPAAGSVPAGFMPPGSQVPPGMYRVVLTVDGQEYTQGIKVEADPVLSGSGAVTEGPEN